MSRQWSGDPQSAIDLRQRTHRQPDERSRQKRRLPLTSETTDDENPLAWTEAKPHTSAVMYTNPYPRRTAFLEETNSQKTKRMRQRRLDRATLMILVCLAIMVMVVGWIVFSKIADWWTGVTDDWRFGNPRTYQTDQFVGQGDSPDHPDHFIVVNTHGQVIVVQINPQHPNLDHTYGITTIDPKVPVSLSFRPMGTTWAMYVIIGDSNPYSVELVSDGKEFVSPH